MTDKNGFPTPPDGPELVRVVLYDSVVGPHVRLAEENDDFFGEEVADVPKGAWDAYRLAAAQAASAYALLRMLASGHLHGPVAEEADTFLDNPETGVMRERPKR